MPCFFISMLLINYYKRGIMRKFVSKLLSLSLAMSLAGSVVAENILDEIQSRGEIRMAIFLKSASPLQRANAQTGEAEGYFADLGRIIAKDLGVKPVFIDSEWKAIIPTLLSGKADMIVAAPSATPVRALSIDFPATTAYYDVSLLVHKDSPVKTLEDVSKSGVRISVMEGSTQHFYAMNSFPNAVIRATEGSMEARLEVASKRADVSFQDSYQSIKFSKEYPQTRVVRDNKGKIVVAQREPGSFAIRQGDPRFYKWLQNWTQWNREQGVLRALYNKWMGPVMSQ